MQELPPQLTPDFEFDAVTITLMNPPSPWEARLVWTFAGMAVAVAVGLAIAEVLFGVVVLGAFVAGAAFLFSIWSHRQSTTLDLTIKRGRIEAGEREFHTGDVVDARWDCTPPTTHLVLVHADGTEEEVLHVRRRTDRDPGITRRQREWVLGEILRQLDFATAAEVPEGLHRLARGRERQ